MPLNSSLDHEKSKTGILYLVSTPIGNLEDITIRAVHILKSVDIIAAEDTRHTGKLLSHFDISTRLVSCHEHNENERSLEFISKMKNGLSIALVSDAGTPLVSDPGYRLVKLTSESGIPVVPIPGVSAAVTALSVSGMSTDSFIFNGFLSKKKTHRLRQITELINEKKTVILYESPHRVVSLLEEIRHILGERKVMVAREMTKLHEEFIRGDVSDVLAELKNRIQIKGECTIVIAGADDSQSPDEEFDIESEIRTRLMKGATSPSLLAKELAVEFRLKKNDLYNLIVKIKNESGM